MNESDIRKLFLANPSPQELIQDVRDRILDPSLPWEEKRPYWHLLFYCGHYQELIDALKISLADRQRIPFDLMIELCARANLKPESIVLESLLKGIRRQKAFEDVLSSRGFDKWDQRFGQVRSEVMENKLEEYKYYKENLKEKFLFLRNQRMDREASRVLRRMRDFFPEDEEFERLGREFREEKAREILSSHLANRSHRELDRAPVEKHSEADQIWINLLFSEGKKLASEKTEIAYNLAMHFLFVEEFDKALEIAALAPRTAVADWLKAELLVLARRFVEALEHLNSLEAKYVDDPETTFAVAYLRAQCLHRLGQASAATEMMNSIYQIRPHYRSAGTLIKEWSQGAAWD